MNEPCYEPGTIKVAWITGREFEYAHSRFFDNLPAAKKFARSLNHTFIMMVLEESNGNYYRWKTLPIGRNYTRYVTGMKISEFFKGIVG